MPRTAASAAKRSTRRRISANRARGTATRVSCNTTQRADLAEDLTLSLRPRIERGLARFYEAARIEAAAALRAHGEHAGADALPTTCPYTLDQITGDWLPNQGRGEQGGKGS